VPIFSLNGQRPAGWLHNMSALSQHGFLILLMIYHVNKYRYIIAAIK